MVSVGVSGVDIFDRVKFLLISVSVSVAVASGPTLDQMHGGDGESGGDEQEGQTARHTRDGGGGNHDTSGRRKLVRNQKRRDFRRCAAGENGMEQIE